MTEHENGQDEHGGPAGYGDPAEQGGQRDQPTAQFPPPAYPAPSYPSPSYPQQPHPQASYPDAPYPAYGQPPPYGQPQYGQAQYGQAQYGQAQYGQPYPGYDANPQYGQQPYPGYDPNQGYGAPGYQQGQPYPGQSYPQQSYPYGYPQQGYQQQSYATPGYQPAQATINRTSLWAALAAAVVVAVALILLFWEPGFAVTKKLSHSAVENYIEQNLGSNNVVCNGGQNIDIEKGKTFTCTGSDGARFSVTITQTNGAHYTAVPDGN